MTPEEWAKEVKERVKYSVNGDQFEQYIAGVIAVAVLDARNQALEEAAGVVANMASSLDKGDPYERTAISFLNETATAIRALKTESNPQQ